MLSGSVGGFVFTSPPVQAIYSAICILSEQNNSKKYFYYSFVIYHEKKI